MEMVINLFSIGSEIGTIASLVTIISAICLAIGVVRKWLLDQRKLRPIPKVACEFFCCADDGMRSAASNANPTLEIQVCNNGQMPFTITALDIEMPQDNQALHLGGIADVNGKTPESISLQQQEIICFTYVFEKDFFEKTGVGFPLVSAIKQNQKTNLKVKLVQPPSKAGGLLVFVKAKSATVSCAFPENFAKYLRSFS